MNKKELLALRKSIKRKKPKFIRQDAHKKKRVSKKWRRPKGLHSKMRLHIKGYRRSISSGYGAPKLVKGLHRSGLKEIIVNNINELSKVNPESEGGVISSNVGIKKKIEILKKCQELKLPVLNVKDTDKFIKDVEDNIKKKKQEKQESKKEKDKKKKEREKIAKEKEKKGKEEAKKEGEEDLATKIKKEEEKKKKEKDKILTQKK